MGSCGFPVSIRRREVVAAVQPVQEHWLAMSNLDLLLPALDVGVFFCYKKLKSKEEAESNYVVKKALAEVLVSFYAFAGEIVENHNGEPELLCNNRGVDFIQAYVDMELKDLDLHRPDASVQPNLVPVKKRGVLAVQVTELKCGGVVIGCTFDHRVADAHSANMFFVAWAELAQAKPVSCIPSFRRSLLNPRRPCLHHSSIDNVMTLLSSLPKPCLLDTTTEDRLLSRIYYVPAEEIHRIQSQASRSKLESFAAFLWKILAEGGEDDTKICKMGVVVDGRQRLKKMVKINFDNYFGNVLSVPYGEATVGQLKAMPIGAVAEVVHAFVEGAANEEHFRRLVDWVELHRPAQAIVKVYVSTEDEEAVVVSSGRQFPVEKMDFGWGRPIFGSYHFPWDGQTGYVMPMPSASRDGDWVVYMYLSRKHIALVEKKAAHVFRPMDPTYYC